MPLVLNQAEEIVAELIHELRQPLSTISDSADYLELTLGGADQRVQEQLRLIARQVNLAANILSRASARVHSSGQ